MGNADWTPDSIAHALPDAGMRQEFWRQFNLTPLDGLKALGEKWVKAIEDLEGAVERGRAVRAFQQQNGGELPAEYSDVTDLIVESRAA
ncbi:hypothetical protein OG883_46230 [Streptomyces sp. NBC_01142]|uniref:hypothetical protein n=1 Tax=Streptomyces sp. NBC_01142 TaxID=2975865 RepID=UPI00225188AE|nr:hypothetical protein [Streptomyces sp. NBC_01142]MCX4827039.1 hypothetical protein [Streptomyces sp. NBC_01142]